jgi:hypothetical protein
VRARDAVQLRPVARHQLGRVVARDQLVEHARRLGVHQQHRPVLAHLLERAEEGAVVRLPPLRLVDHELLERGEAALHHPRDLVPLLLPARDADVERVVDQRLPLRLPHPRVGGVGERAAGRRDREVDHRRHAAARAGARARAVVVRRHGAAERQLEVHVHVEHAREDEVSAGVGHLGAAASSDAPRAAIFSPTIPTSPANVPPGVTTVPPAMTRSKRMRP